jgi:hypothetical protein
MNYSIYTWKYGTVSPPTYMLLNLFVLISGKPKSKKLKVSDLFVPLLPTAFAVVGSFCFIEIYFYT